MESLRHWGRAEGIFAAPEGAASLAAYRDLRTKGFFTEEDQVVLFNTGTGLKYLDLIQKESSASPPARHIGGIIGPY